MASKYEQGERYKVEEGYLHEVGSLVCHLQPIHLHHHQFTLPKFSVESSSPSRSSITTAGVKVIDISTVIRQCLGQYILLPLLCLSKLIQQAQVACTSSFEFFRVCTHTSHPHSGSADKFGFFFVTASSGITEGTTVVEVLIFSHMTW